MSNETLGAIVDASGNSLGKYPVPAENMILGSVVLLEVIDPEGSVTTQVYFSDSLTHSTGIGMLAKAYKMELDATEKDE